MARGTVVGETPVSQAATPEYLDGHARTFGNKTVERGRWIWDGERKELVRAENFRPPERALDAPIMMDRFYENTRATDGTDIGSRRKHRQYMKDHGLTTADDFGGEWKKAQARREDVKQGKWADPKRHEALERAFWKIAGKP